MSRPRDVRQDDLFRPALDRVIDLNHPLAQLAQRIDWTSLERRFGEFHEAGPGRPPLPVRLIAGLMVLKHLHRLSDKALCARWLENPYFQYFCGEHAFRHELPFERSSLSRWRHRVGKERLAAMVEESLAEARR
jgi:transposase, IS5 family